MTQCPTHPYLSTLLVSRHVDSVDQMRKSYGLECSVRCTWPSLAWWLIDTCIVNVYALWSLDTGTQSEQLPFRQQLTHQIAALFPPSRTHVQPKFPYTAAPIHPLAEQTHE